MPRFLYGVTEDAIRAWTNSAAGNRSEEIFVRRSRGNPGRPLAQPVASQPAFRTTRSAGGADASPDETLSLLARRCVGDGRIPHARPINDIRTDRGKQCDDGEGCEDFWKRAEIGLIADVRFVLHFVPPFFRSPRKPHYSTLRGGA